MDTEWIDAAGDDDVAVGECLGLRLGEVRVVLVRAGAAAWYALHDRCTHGAARLSEGFVEDGCIECPLHQGRFDLATGAPRSAPITKGVKTYPLRHRGGRIEIAL